MAGKRCGNCRWLRVPDAENRRKRRPRHCDYPLPAMPALPDSITRTYGYRPVRLEDKRMMWTDDGQDCPTWERISKREGAADA